MESVVDSRRRRRRARNKWIAALGLTLGGCASTCGDPVNPGTIGELGNGRFLYVCVRDGDPICESNAFGDDFPECIALGGVFDIDYQLLDTSSLDNDFDITPVLYVESVSQNFFSGTDQFEARRAGEAAFLVREEQNVLDLIHLRTVEPDALDLVDPDSREPAEELTLSAGETVVYRVFPRSSQCQRLGGAVSFSANSSDETIVTTSSSDTLSVQAQAAGTAVIRVRLGEVERMLTVNVVDGPIGPDPEPTGSAPSSGDDDGTSDDSGGTSTGGTTESDQSSTGGSSTGEV